MRWKNKGQRRRKKGQKRGKMDQRGGSGGVREMDGDGLEKAQWETQKKAESEMERNWERAKVRLISFSGPRLPSKPHPRPFRLAPNDILSPPPGTFIDLKTCQDKRNSCCPFTLHTISQSDVTRSQTSCSAGELWCSQVWQEATVWRHATVKCQFSIRQSYFF